jgi:hypothetical protein
VTWVRLDDEFPKHPKIAEVGPLGLAMQVAGLCYCNHYLTDGYVPRAVAATLLDLEGIGIFTGTYTGEDAHWKLVAECLVIAGVWDEVEGGYEIHDYDEYQPSREQVLEERAKKQAAGRAGGKATAAARAKAPASSGGAAVAQAKSKPVPVPDPVPKPGLEEDLSKGVGEDVHKELLVTRLLGALGDVDEQAVAAIRNLAKTVPPAALVKVYESLQSQSVRNPVGYVLSALRSEVSERRTEAVGA